MLEIWHSNWTVIVRTFEVLQSTIPNRLNIGLWAKDNNQFEQVTKTTQQQPATTSSTYKATAKEEPQARMSTLDRAALALLLKFLITKIDYVARNNQKKTKYYL